MEGREQPQISESKKKKLKRKSGEWNAIRRRRRAPETSEGGQNVRVEGRGQGRRMTVNEEGQKNMKAKENSVESSFKEKILMLSL